MKKAFLLFALLALVLPARRARYGRLHDRTAGKQPRTINMMGWTYPIIDFYADELEACNAGG